MPRGTPQGGEEKDQKFQPIYSNVWVQEQDVHSQFSQFHRGWENIQTFNYLWAPKAQTWKK